MIRHIVMFKLKEFATPADKQAKMQEIKTGLEALIDKIDVLRMIRVDFNVNPAETWDIILTTELDTLEDHPPRTCSRIQGHHRSRQGRQSLRRL